MKLNEYPYTLVIETESEYDALLWASARWNGAEVLYECWNVPDDAQVDAEDNPVYPLTVGFREHEAWTVKEAIEAEDAGYIPCLSASLTRRITAMLDSIV